MNNRKTRIGIMGLGNIGRQIYHLASQSDDIEVVAISDIGKPEVLSYLLDCDALGDQQHQIEGNFLVNPKFRTRMLQNVYPDDIPWDAFDVDMVIDSTAQFRHIEDMQAHLDNGARRVLLGVLPEDELDRMVIPGINDSAIRCEDRLISAGSATTAALALMLKTIDDALGVNYASMTTVHAYTSDQPLQDYAGRDQRRSRSAAENIIPNSNQSPQWVEKLIPKFEGKLNGFALNVPVQKTAMLDLSLVMSNADCSAEDICQAMEKAASRHPDLIEVTHDPIVSSDVIGNSHSVVFDALATMKAGSNMIKTLCWYESLGHASRIVDVIRLYHAADCNQPSPATTANNGGDQ